MKTVPRLLRLVEEEVAEMIRDSTGEVKIDGDGQINYTRSLLR
jgi:hypothetical protein